MVAQLLHLVYLLILPCLLAQVSGPSRPVTATGEGPDPATFEQLFEPVDRIRLQDPDPEPMGEVPGLDVGPAGRLAVADRQSSRIFIFEPTGTLHRVLGGWGEGPGEFLRPVDVAFDRQGRLYVADVGVPRITRFTQDFRLDTTFRLERVRYPRKVEAVEGRLLLYVAPAPPDTRSLRFYSFDGEWLESFHPEAAAYREVPYWAAASESRLAASPQAIIAGANLLYPFAVYRTDGTLADSVGEPPSRWIQAPRPERGQFRGPDRFQKFAAWRRTFTTVQALAVLSDRFLVVSHERLDSGVLAYEDGSYFADVYAVDGWRKRWTDVDLPGLVLRGGQALYLLENEPPAGWVVAVYGLSR